MDQRGIEVVEPSQALILQAFPALVEGNDYLVEFIDDEITRKAKLVRMSEQPLGWGITLECGKRRRFVYLEEIHHVAGNHICVMGGL
jgi:hypothetical protein